MFVNNVKKVRELFEYIFEKLQLKGNKFQILPPASEDEINYFVESELNKCDSDLVNLKSHEDIAKFPRIKSYFDAHITRRTYFFQIR